MRYTYNSLRNTLSIEVGEQIDVMEIFATSQIE
jgi:hypothetical protein